MTDDAGVNVWPIEGPHATMLEAIVSGLAGLRSLLPEARNLPADIDLVAAENEETAVVAETVAVLAMQLMRELAGDGQLSLLGATTGHDVALGDLSAAVAAMPRVSRDARSDAKGDAAGIIREIGLERYDRDCHLGTGADGKDLIVSSPILSETAHVWLLDRLFQRVEMFALRDELIALERGASAWYFARWSAAGTRKDRVVQDFARGVREQEWSLVERHTLALGMPVVTALPGQPFFSTIPPRQQQLARALRRSVADVYEVQDVSEHWMTLRPIRGGRTYEVHEHNDEANPVPGMLVMGRLIPFANGRWLRSPGALLMMPQDARQRAMLVEGLTRSGAGLPIPIMIEALISALLHRARLPMSPKPVSSAIVARDMFQEFYDVLDARGRRREVSREEAPPELRERLTGAEAHFFTAELDDTLAEWSAALSRQAGIAAKRAGRGAKESAEKRGKKRRPKR